jgi:hypothetical protein
MIRGAVRTLRDPWMLVELFIIGNLSFLAVDVYIAHSVNTFERRQEWIPVFFSIAAPVVLIVGLALSQRIPALLIGWTSVIVGVAGMLFHLQSHFFEEQTIRNLVYTAPFIAPLSYAGLGLLLICDRMVDRRSLEWAQWIVFLALCGFGGNFALSLADHAQNGFFNWMEWIPVLASALAIGFLFVAVMRPLDRPIRTASWLVMVLQIVVGVAGFALHVRANLHAESPRLWDRFVFGAPAFAPLLFANLALLAAIGLWSLSDRVPSTDADSPIQFRESVT